jgi:hypothetical protein
MAEISPQIPEIGQPNNTEDPKIVNALTTITDEINGNLDNDNIASGANINGSKLLAASVDTTQLAASAVETAKIADSNVTTAKIADSNVTTAKIADDAVTSAKLNMSYTSAEMGSDSSLIGTSESTVLTSDSLGAGTYLMVAAVMCKVKEGDTMTLWVKDGASVLATTTVSAADSTALTDIRISASMIDVYVKPGTGTLTLTAQGSSIATGTVSQYTQLAAVRIA